MNTAVTEVEGVYESYYAGNGYDKFFGRGKKVVDTLTELINMQHIDRYCRSIASELPPAEKEYNDEYLRQCNKNVTYAMEGYIKSFEGALRRSDWNSDALLLMLTRLDADLKHLFNYYLTQEHIWKYIIENWHGEYRHLKFRANLPTPAYNSEKPIPYITEKKNITGQAIDGFAKRIRHYWAYAFSHCIILHEKFNDAVIQRSKPGRKVYGSTLEDIYISDEMLKKDLQNLLNKKYIISSNDGKYKWNKKKNELGVFYHQALKAGRFKRDISETDIKYALLSFFGLPCTKYNKQVFQTVFYESNMSVIRKRIVG